MKLLNAALLQGVIAIAALPPMKINVLNSALIFL